MSSQSSPVRSGSAIVAHTTRYLPGPVARLREHLRVTRSLVAQTHDAVATSRNETSRLASELARLNTRLDALEAAHTVNSVEARAEHEQLVEILRFVLSQPAQRAARLRQIRDSAPYLSAYTTPEPLISVVIPTYDNYEMLERRSIPSVLGQTYQNFEIVVVGDAAPEESRAVIERFGDPRISYFNLPYRGPYPSDPRALWLVAGTPPFNEAVRRAKGSWIALIDDDDAFLPDHLRLLFRHAQSEHLELVYAALNVHHSRDKVTRVGRFPPQLGHFGMQAAVWHAGLAGTFEYELMDGALGLPTDWATCQRMMEAGVRIGFIDQATVDYYPSGLWRPDPYQRRQ